MLVAVAPEKVKMISYDFETHCHLLKESSKDIIVAATSIPVNAV